MEQPSVTNPSPFNQPRPQWNAILEDDMPRSLDGVVFVKRSELSIGPRVGSGSFGTVYSGRLWDKRIAFKVLHVKNSLSRVGYLAGHDETPKPATNNKQKILDLVTALEKEVKVLKCLSSCKEIVQFFGVCLEPAGIITEFCQNESLFDFIGENLRRNDDMECMRGMFVRECKG